MNMSRQAAFSEHEAVLLLDAYLKVLRGEKSRKDAIQNCSTQLRQMAMNSCKHIDDVYRNVNGITFQLASMESAYQGHTIMKPATRLFTQIVDLYRNNTEQYQKLLMEAKKMSKTLGESEEVFMSWLSEIVSANQLSELYLALYEIEAQAKKDKLIKLSLYEKLDPASIKRIKTSIEGSRLFKNTHKRQWSRILSALNYLLKYSIQEDSVLKDVVAERTVPDTTSANKDSAFVSVENDSDFVEQGGDVSKGENSESRVIPTSEAIIDFENIGDIAFSKPVSLSYFGEIKEETSWKGMYVDACKYLLDDYPYVFERLKKESLSGSSNIWLVDENHLGLLSVPKIIQDGFYVETNRSAVDLVQNLKWILEECSVDYENVVIAYYGSNLSQAKLQSVNTVDERWLSILKDYFQDGYILDDFLSQFQAGAFWQERFSESCPIEGNVIDDAMKAVGIIRDGRVFPKKEKDRALISSICEEISNILSRYSAVYRVNIYSRYQEQLASCQIYTEEVMTQQLLKVANSRFYSYYQCFVKQGQEASVTNDARTVLRNHGGAMSVSDITNELWFIPYDIVYHCLTLDEETISIGNSVWMLAENFPFTEEDAKLVGDILDECFLSQTFVKAQDLISLLKQHLPSIADNLASFHFTAVFNIFNYYLKNRFSFSRATISPKGAKTEFRDLFRGFAQEHEQFTLEELSAFARDLQVPIYWESTFNGGAVRISRTEFVNRSRVSFDIVETDKVLENFCTGDYLPLQEVSSAMMMHLPSCGYRWNGYLLLSYLYAYSKMFRLFYNSLGKSGYYGALVKRSCVEIDCYERLVEQVLIQDQTWQTEGEAMDILIDKGLQAQRRLKGIDQIVEKAKNSRIHEKGDKVFA